MKCISRFLGTTSIGRAPMPLLAPTWQQLSRARHFLRRKSFTSWFDLTSARVHARFVFAHIVHRTREDRGGGKAQAILIGIVFA